MANKRATEIYCHGCEKYIQVELDYSLNGNHRINCPNCGHPHYRVIKNGIITSERYAMFLQTYTYSLTSATSTSIYNGTANDTYLAESWASACNMTTGTGGF